MASHASQFIVLVLGLGDTITCKLSNVYSTTPRRTGTFLVQSTASYAFGYLGFLTQLFIIISRSRFQPTSLRAKDLPAETAAKSMIRKLVDDHDQLYIRLVSSYSIL